MPRRLLVAGALALALAALLIWSPWSDEPTVRTPATAGTPSAPTTAGPTPTPSVLVDAAAATAAICALAPSVVAALAVPELAERVTAVERAAQGRPDVVPLTTQAEELLRVRRADASASEIDLQLARLRQTFEAVPAALRTC